MNSAKALQSAIKEAGGLSQLAKYLGRDVIEVAKWNEVPLRFCYDVETLTGVTCEELRPDVLWARDINDHVTGWIPSSKQV